MCARILIVSSDSRTTALLRACLKDAPAETDWVATLESAQKRLHSEKPPDLIYLHPYLTDCATEALPAFVKSSFADVPVILVVKPDMDIELVKSFYRAGVDSHVELFNDGDAFRHILTSAKNCFLRQERTERATA